MRRGSIVAIIAMETAKINPALTLYLCTIIQNSWFFPVISQIPGEAAKRPVETGK
jgi:hypothetical protein